MIRYRFLSPAKEEMIEAMLFYETASIGLEIDFLDDLQRTIDTLTVYPELGQPIDSDFRRILLHRFPFSLIYALEQNGILIVAVAHHGREPEYWRSRLN